MDWQPIETAPRDGSHFLAFGNGAPERAIIYDDVKDWKPRIRICWWISYEMERDEPAAMTSFAKSNIAMISAGKAESTFDQRTGCRCRRLPTPPGH